MEVIKLCVIFALIMVFLGLGQPMYLVMTGAIILTGLLFAMPPLDWALAIGKSAVSESTVMVVLIVWLVMLMVGVMNNNGYLTRLTDAMDDMFHSRRLNIVSMPVIIGFLPSAGGALLSAPMVEEAARNCGLDVSTKSNVNVFYRHIMELAFPTYSALIVLSQISGVPLSRLILLMLPLAIFALLEGLLMLRKVPASDKNAGSGLPWYRRLWRLLQAMWPFLLLLGLIMGTRMRVQTACLISLLAVMAATRTGPRQVPELIRAKTKWRLVLITLTIMIFKDLLTVSGALETLPAAVSKLPLPPLFIYSLICIFIGMITGVTISSTGIVIPLLMATIPDFTPAMLCFLHMSGYIGAQITPTHSCVTLSADYFQAPLGRTILRSLPLYVGVYAMGCLLYLWILA